jgi:hypothetical protein
MSTNIFLTEGGVAGHMCHLYDNCDLTFAEIKDVFQKASNGEDKIYLSLTQLKTVRPRPLETKPI